MGEAADVPCAGVKCRADGPNLFELGHVGLGEVLGVRHDPADDTAGLRWRPRVGWRSWWVLEKGAVGLLERAEVAPDALDVAAEALLAQFEVELGNAVAALDPPLMQVAHEIVQEDCLPLTCDHGRLRSFTHGVDLLRKVVPD
ncbi:hypothetical protein ABCR94_17595 [Streptomyces sp. 21So2-11]|uniref:hypothetical protein n=1 Tax=Streptomyces sp. 21So2-11 TaxID=3144408 RepID=UPI00321BDA96